jgi:cholesterol transport system auxiliary component
MRRPLLALTLSLAAAGGCSNLFHSDAKPEQTFVLRAPATAAAAPAVALLAPIEVAHPAAAPGLDGPHIILVQPDHRSNFYVGSRWPAPLSDMVEALAVETLRASGDWQSVQDSASPFTSEYLLWISVRRFEADYSRRHSAPEVEVMLDCTVGAREGRELVASFVARGTATAADDRMTEVIAAFETATDTALTSLAQQAAAAARAHAARGTAAAH